MPLPTWNEAVFMFSCTRLEHDHLMQTHKKKLQNLKEQLILKVIYLTIYLICILSYFQFTLPRQINGYFKAFLNRVREDIILLFLFFPKQTNFIFATSFLLILKF